MSEYQYALNFESILIYMLANILCKNKKIIIVRFYL